MFLIKNQKIVNIISLQNLEILTTVTNSNFCFVSVILNSLLALLEGLSWVFSQLTLFSNLHQNKNKNEISSESWKTWIFYLIVLKVSESLRPLKIISNWIGWIVLSLVNSFCCFSRSKVTLNDVLHHTYVLIRQIY